MLDSPAVRTLSRYLVARFVQLFFLVAFVAVLSTMVIELLLNLDRMIEFGDGLQGALHYLWLRLASEYASYIVPLAAFLAAFSTAALAAYAREWLALRASGISLARFALPSQLPTRLAVTDVTVLGRNHRRIGTEVRQGARVFRFHRDLHVGNSQVILHVVGPDRVGHHSPQNCCFG